MRDVECTRVRHLKQGKESRRLVIVILLGKENIGTYACLQSRIPSGEPSICEEREVLLLRDRTSESHTHTLAKATLFVALPFHRPREYTAMTFISTTILMSYRQR